MDRMHRRFRRSLASLPPVVAIPLGFIAGCLIALASAVDSTDSISSVGMSSASGADPLALITAELGSPVGVMAAIEPAPVAGGADVLAVTATLEEGWHLYSLTQKPGGPLATRITIAADSPRRPSGAFQADPPAVSHVVDDIPAWKGLVVEEHEGIVTWRAPLAAGSGAVRGSVMVQLCRDNACLPPETLDFTAVAPGGGSGREATVVSQARHDAERSHAAVVARWGDLRDDGRPLVVTLEPEGDWHVYAPAGSAASGIGQGKPTIVAAGARGRIVTVTAVGVRPASTAELAAAGAVEGPVVLEVLFGATDDDPVEVLLGFQTCSETTCDPPTAVRLTASQPAAGEAAAFEFTAAKYAEAGRAPVAISTIGAPAADPRMAADGAALVAGGGPLPFAGPSSRGLTLPIVLLMGIAGGLILNLMPCVLPVLGLKLMSFAQQSGRGRREVFEMNLWYCAGLFAVFFMLATASVAANIGLGSANLAWGEQFTSASFNIGMVAIVFAFALSFLGIWELPIPGFIGEQAGHAQSREGPLGAFLKGVLSTVLATPCSGPFLGPVFGFTLAQPTAVTYAVFGSIATGMALPYILVGFFPGLVRVLPKPGAWMETFKELLGFVMLGTVVYLFTFLHHQWFVPTLALLVGIWAACWWVGKAQEKFGAGVGFGRWVQAAAFAAAVGTAAFMYLGPSRSLIEWEQPFSRSRLAELRQAGNTVMVDFSADWCPTCKFNLATAIETRRVKALIEKNRVVPLLADWTDGSLEIKQMLESLESRSIPVLAIFPGGEPGQPLAQPIVLRDLLTESQVLEALERAGPSCCPPPEIRAASAAPALGGR